MSAKSICINEAKKIISGHVSALLRDAYGDLSDYAKEDERLTAARLINEERRLISPVVQGAQEELERELKSALLKSGVGKERLGLYWVQIQALIPPLTTPRLTAADFDGTKLSRTQTVSGIQTAADTEPPARRKTGIAPFVTDIAGVALIAAGAALYHPVSLTACIAVGAAGIFVMEVGCICFKKLPFMPPRRVSDMMSDEDETEDNKNNDSAEDKLESLLERQCAVSIAAADKWISEACATALDSDIDF